MNPDTIALARPSRLAPLHGAEGVATTHVSAPPTSGFHVLTIINNTGLPIDPGVSEGYATYTPTVGMPFNRNVPYIATGNQDTVTSDPETYSPTGIDSIYVEVTLNDGGAGEPRNGFATQTGDFTWSITFT
jgi:hypothetical protein